MTVVDLLQILEKGGGYVLALAVIWGFMTGRIVPGWVYRESKSREQKWEALALRGTQIGREAVQALTEVTKEA